MIKDVIEAVGDVLEGGCDEGGCNMRRICSRMGVEIVHEEAGRGDTARRRRAPGRGGACVLVVEGCVHL